MAARKTRAAAKAQDESHQDTPLPDDQTTEHEPQEDPEESHDPVEDMSRPKSRKGGKNSAKKKAAKKVKATPETAPEAEAVEATPAPVVEDGEFNPAAMPVLRTPKKDIDTAESIAIEKPLAQDPVAKTRPATPDPDPQLPARMTRRQLALAEATPALDPDSTIEDPVTEDSEAVPVATVDEAILAVEAVEQLATPAEEPSVAPPEPHIIGERAPVVEPSEHPIDALDALEDTLDEVDKIIPGLDLPVTKPKTSEPRTFKAPSPSVLQSTTAKKQPSATKPLARSGSVKTKATPKIATTTQPSAAARPRAPASASTSNRASTVARSNSVKTTNPSTSSTGTLGRSTSTRARPMSMVAPKPAANGGPDKKPDYLAAKRRPISLQFPNPPPVPKSTKPVTQSTFKLPGEDVAAKLKQAKEERQKRMEAKEAEKKEAKPRPTIRKPVNTNPVPNKSRLSTGGAMPVKEKENVPSGGLKRSSTVTGGKTNRGSMIADRSKRTSMIGSAEQKAYSSSLSMPKQRAAATTTSPAANTSAKRLSTRASSTSLGGKSRNVSTASSTTATKGKEVFNRDRKTSEVLEREKRDKDDAVKKARADAAERGRQASKDWAAKQKKIKSEAVAARRESAEAVAV